jgi:LuxR family transcriptional regulator, quorum-sensing system regulator BjaR1
MSFETIAMEAVDRLRQATNVLQAMSDLKEITTPFGSSAFIIANIPSAGAPERDDVQLSGWSDEWLHRYLSKKYGAYDPIPNTAKISVDPYFWHDAAARMPEPSSQLVMNEASHEFRMRDGFCIPIHGLRGNAGLVSFASEQQPWELSESETAALDLIGLYAYEAIRRITAKSKKGGEGGTPKLSRRERECVAWTAEGKTAWEISAILGLSESTVLEYLASASRKLGTHTKPHLVARALRYRIID